MSNPELPSEPTAPRPEPAAARPRFNPFRTGRRRVVAAAALVGAFAVGSGVTAVALQNRHPSLVMLTPAPISAMHDGSAVAVKGKVAEIFGNKFVVADDSGRALVETGRSGESKPLVADAEPVTVQGRFEHGFIHAQAISHADGRNDFVGDIAILCDSPRTATVKAASRCETLVIGKVQLMGLLKSFPEMGIAMMRVLAQRLERTSHALAEAQRRNASLH